MAYLPESEMDKQRRLQEQGGAGQPQQIGGSSGVITGGAGQGQAGAQQQGPSSSGSFTGINKYLSANRDQGQTLAKNVAGKVGEQAEGAKTSLNTLNQNFQNQVQQNSVKRDQNLVQEAVANPTNIVNDPTKTQQFTKMRDAQYKGPSQLADVDGYLDVQTNVNKAQGAVEGSKSEQGRFALLQQSAAKPSYSRGQQRLDQMLLQNTPEARTEFQDLQTKYDGLSGMLSQQQEQANASAKAAQEETLAARNDVQSALFDQNTGALPGFERDLNSRVQSERERQMRMQQNITNDISDDTLSEETLAALGLSEGANLYDAKLSDYLGEEFLPDNVNAQNFASADDYARYQALSQLAGQDPTLLYDNKMAGTSKGYSANKDQLKAQLENAKGRYDSHMTKLPGLQQEAINLFGNNGVGVDSPEEFRALIKQYRDYKTGINADQGRWLDNLDAGTVPVGTNGYGLQGNAYVAIQDFLKKYDSLSPTRTAKKG